MSSDIFGAIREKMSACSKGQQRIAKYILENAHRAAFLTASALGREVQVSESTVVRFAGDLGYQGYPQMQKALQDLVMHHLSVETDREQMHSGSQADSVSGAFQRIANALQITEQKLSRTEVQAAIEILLHAKRIYLMGIGESYPIALHAFRSLQSLFLQVSLVNGTSDKDCLRQLVQISPQDVFLCVCLSSNCNAEGVCLEYVRQIAAKTILLAEKPNVPFFGSVDCLLCIDPSEIGSDCTVISAMSILQVLCEELALLRQRESERYFKIIEEIWETYHVNDKTQE